MKSDEKCKELQVMEEEETEEDLMLNKLLSFSNEKIQFRIKSQANPNNYAIVRTRKLKQNEISEYRHKLHQIDKRLTEAESTDQIPLTPSQSDQVDTLIEEFVKKAVIISEKNRKKLDEILADPNIRVKLFEGIMGVSTPDNADLEALQKFRNNQ